MRETHIASSVLAIALPLVALYACGGTGGTDTAGAGGSDVTGAGGSGVGGAASGGKGGAAGKGSAGTVGKGGAAGAGAAGGAATGGASAGSAGSGFGGGGGSAPCAAGTITCDGTTKKVCDGKGGFSETTACPKACAPNLGCAECVPGTGTCAGTTSMVCKADGSGIDAIPCDPDLGLTCVPGKGTCSGACSKDNLERSYIGCEYYPTVTSNGNLYKGFHFAIAVANTTAASANVKVLKGAQVVAMQTIAAGKLVTIQLPWVPELKNDYTSGSAMLTSVTSAQGAYHVKSDQPVTVYQFNPLEFQIPPDGACPDPQLTGMCNSFTNDASLLLPVNTLGLTYVVASAPTLNIGAPGNAEAIPGLTSITATEDGTKVTVASTAYVRAGAGVKAMSPGDTQVFTMNHGDVVQLLSGVPKPNELTGCVTFPNGAESCAVPKTYDLTGTLVTADKPIQVIGGHDCTFMPHQNYACDHIEEALFPMTTLGKDVLVTAPQSVLGAQSNDGKPDKHFIRVISAMDGNAITLDPLPAGASNGTLNKGQYADVPITTQDLHVTGSGPLLVAQYMLGGDLVDPGAQGPSSKGDPSLSLGIPSAQFRKSYTFLAPDTYTFNFVNITAPAGVTVTLDGTPVTSPAAAPIGASGFTVVRKAIPGGSHTITADKPFGIVVYGYGSYTSYMYPGGLNLNAL